jgi:hypothetical protein
VIPGRALWRAVTENRTTMLLATLLILAAVIVVESVMANRYRLGIQLGTDKRLELAPAGSIATP